MQTITKPLVLKYYTAEMKITGVVKNNGKQLLNIVLLFCN